MRVNGLIHWAMTAGALLILRPFSCLLVFGLLVVGGKVEDVFGAAQLEGVVPLDALALLDLVGLVELDGQRQERSYILPGYQEGNHDAEHFLNFC